MATKKENISKEPYKGVRDFYPEDKFRQNFIFDKWRKVAERFGYEEMGASPLEPTELFEAKTGEEIINEQTYTFEDRGGRRVTLRPEMTPTVARMVAAKKREMSFPTRLYSITNFFRYERPQKGRLREFYQLNADLFGASGADADFETINLAYSIMKEFGVDDSKYEIRINNRKYLTSLLQDFFSLNDDAVYKTSKLIDRRGKISEAEFMEQSKLLLKDKTESFLEVFKVKNLEELEKIDSFFKGNEGIIEMRALFSKLDEAEINNYRFEPTLIRGLDYYTGIIFEVYDTGGENIRSLYGGGRYDNLLEIFGEEAVPTIGFAIGDVPMSDFLETYKLFPKYQSSTDLYICTLGNEFTSKANELAKELRISGLNVVVNLSNKKVGEQIAMAGKKSIPFILCIGQEEINSGRYKVKNLQSGEENDVAFNEIASIVKVDKSK